MITTDSFLQYMCFLLVTILRRSFKENIKRPENLNATQNTLNVSNSSFPYTSFRCSFLLYRHGTLPFLMLSGAKCHKQNNLVTINNNGNRTVSHIIKFIRVISILSEFTVTSHLATTF